MSASRNHSKTRRLQYRFSFAETSHKPNTEVGETPHVGPLVQDQGKIGFSLPMLDRITVHGARQHNLKNIDVEIPRNTFTVITGLSGSGKSSLAFDTIYAEGQRRYVETLSTYARQFLDQMER